MVVLMNLDQPLPGNLPQPGIEWERLVPQIIIEFVVCLHEHLLHNVGGVDPG
jgi:hypothetical protein